jgi:hypothetical protein
MKAFSRLPGLNEVQQDFQERTDYGAQVVTSVKESRPPPARRWSGVTTPFPSVLRHSEAQRLIGNHPFQPTLLVREPLEQPRIVH